MDAVQAEQAGASRADERARSRACGSSTSAPASPRRSAPGCSASRAPRSSRSSSPARGDFMREIGPFVPDDASPTARRPATRCSGRSRGAAARASRSTCASPRARTCSAGSPRPPTSVVENFRPGHARAVEHRRRPTSTRQPRDRAHQQRSARTGRTRQRPGLDRVGIGYGGLLHLTGYPDRPPVRVGVTISDYLTGVFAAQAAIGRAVRARRAPRRGRAR